MKFGRNEVIGGEDIEQGSHKKKKPPKEMDFEE